MRQGWDSLANPDSDVFTVAAGDAIELWCYDVEIDSTVYGGTITATLIGSVTSPSKASAIR